MKNILKKNNMAKKILKEKSIEETLWESANKLRGSVEPSEYKHVVLSLIKGRMLKVPNVLAKIVIDHVLQK